MSSGPSITWRGAPKSTRRASGHSACRWARPRFGGWQRSSLASGSRSTSAASTDYDELIRTHGLKEHGVYYYVPSLLKHFDTAGINELIVPRPRLSLNGRLDLLTPPAGVERVRE